MARTRRVSKPSFCFVPFIFNLPESSGTLLLPQTEGVFLPSSLFFSFLLVPLRSFLLLIIFHVYFWAGSIFKRKRVMLCYFYFLILIEKLPEQNKTNKSFLLLTSTACVAEAWWSVFVELLLLYCCLHSGSWMNEHHIKWDPKPSHLNVKSCFRLITCIYNS